MIVRIFFIYKYEKNTHYFLQNKDGYGESYDDEVIGDAPPVQAEPNEQW